MSDEAMKLTRQGVRDLGSGCQRKQVIVTCLHVWEDELQRVYDYCSEAPYRRVRRCGFCGAVQS